MFFLGVGRAAIAAAAAAAADFCIFLRSLEARGLKQAARASLKENPIYFLKTKASSDHTEFHTPFFWFLSRKLSLSLSAFHLLLCLETSAAFFLCIKKKKEKRKKKEGASLRSLFSKCLLEIFHLHLAIELSGGARKKMDDDCTF